MTNEKRQAVSDPAPSTSLTDEVNSTNATTDFEDDRRAVADVNDSLWNAIYAGTFRLAVRCKRCGTWLTNSRSKRHGLGPTCARKAVTDDRLRTQR
ncbi:MAG: DUF6011 domain-containing protein [Mycobacterium sp.]